MADILADHPRARYASIHEEGGFPMTGKEVLAGGPNGNLYSMPLGRGAGEEEFLGAFGAALDFLLSDDFSPGLLLVCAGYDALDSDPLATMSLTPETYGKMMKVLMEKYPRKSIALGLEGGYNLDAEVGMPAALRCTLEALTGV